MFGIEKAISTEDRRDAAISSQNHFLAKRRTVLAKQYTELSTAIDKASDPVRKAELQKRLEQNEDETREFRLRCTCSSLQRQKPSQGDAGNKKPDTFFCDAVERRVAVVPGGGRVVTKPTSPTEPKTKLTGYAAVFDLYSLDLGGWKEKIQRGAFSTVLKREDLNCFALFNHDPNHVLARTTNGTLRLGTNSHNGLGFWADLLPDDPESEGIAARVGRGDLTQCSFAFTVGADTWELAKRPGELDIRIIQEIGELYDISVVTRPAYPSTIVQVVQERTKSTSNYDDDDWEAQEYEEFSREYDRKRQLVSAARQRKVELDYRRAGRAVDRAKCLIKQNR